MNLFIQGMRRSGTTIVLDCFMADPSLTCYYEPLAAARKPALGGGSGAREVDYFAGLEELRREHAGRSGHGRGLDFYNHGAPREVSLELTRKLPQALLDYLAFLCSRQPDTVIKFTRMGRKIGDLATIDPEARLLHVVRDPRRVVASYLFGKNQRNRAQFRVPEDFFESRRKRLPWSATKLSDELLREGVDDLGPQPADHLRLLLLWRDGFESTWEDGREYFGDRYRLVRHEDLASRPVETLTEIYRFLGRSLPREVTNWAAGSMRPPSPVFAPDSPHWGEAVRRVRLEPALERSGYRFA